MENCKPQYVSKIQNFLCGGGSHILDKQTIKSNMISRNVRRALDSKRSFRGRRNSRIGDSAAYDYREAIIEDIESEVDPADYAGLDQDEVAEKLDDDLWANDNVTGNGSGSYNFDPEVSRKCVEGNEYLAQELIPEFGLSAEDVAEHLFDYEYWDVYIRCYLLHECIGEYLERHADEFDFNSEDSEDIEDSAKRRAIRAKRVRDNRKSRNVRLRRSK